MSFDFNWENITSDEKISSNIKEFLNEQFSSIELPSFIDELVVTDFSLGNIPPEVTIRFVGNPFEEFYLENGDDFEEKREVYYGDSRLSDSDSSFSEDEGGHTTINDIVNHNDRIRPEGKNDEESGGMALDIVSQFHNYNMNNLGLGPRERKTPTTFFTRDAYRLRSASTSDKKEKKKSDNDIQFVLEVDYHGDIMLELSVNLLVHYPSTKFISLPIKLKVTDLEVHSLAVIAYVQGRVFISLLCDLSDSASDYFTSSNLENLTSKMKSRGSPSTFGGGTLVDYAASGNAERIDVIRGVKIDTEIGEVENNILRNVGKIEKFLIEQLRNIIREELCWPSWICLDFLAEEML